MPPESLRPTLEERLLSKNLSLKESFPEVGVAVGAEHCRVYAAAYTSRQEAVNNLPAFRNEHPWYAKAWVLVQ